MKKWNRKICVEYITQLKSPIEEIQGAGGSGQKPWFQQMADRLNSLKR